MAGKGNEFNGVDTDALQETLGAIQKDPKLAEFVFRAVNNWTHGTLNQIDIKEFDGAGQERHERPADFSFKADEPPVLLGKNRGANPVEYLLGALSSCLTTTLALHATANGITVEEMNSSYEGDLDLNGFLGFDPEVRKGYKQIRVDFSVRTDAEKSKVEELLEQSVVLDTLRNPVPVEINVKKI